MAGNALFCFILLALSHSALAFVDGTFAEHGSYAKANLAQL
jgi:hypothetical protein